ncbi:hypothetical protein BGZ73_000471, partial [Actinomortierella ambigua]
MATVLGEPPTSPLTQPRPSFNTAGLSFRDVAARSQPTFNFMTVFSHPSLGHLATLQRAKYGSTDLFFTGSTLYQLNASDNSADFILAVTKTFTPESTSHDLRSLPFLNVRLHAAKNQVEILYHKRFADNAQTTPVCFNNRDISPHPPPAPEGTISRFIFSNFPLPANHDWDQPEAVVDYVARLLTQTYDAGEVIKIELRQDRLNGQIIGWFNGSMIVYTHGTNSIDDIDRRVPHRIPEEMWPTWKLRARGAPPLLLNWIHEKPACRFCHEAGHFLKDYPQRLQQHCQGCGAFGHRVHMCSDRMRARDKDNTHEALSSKGLLQFTLPKRNRDPTRMPQDGPQAEVDSETLKTMPTQSPAPITVGPIDQPPLETRQGTPDTEFEFSDDLVLPLSRSPSVEPLEDPPSQNEDGDATMEDVS